MGSNSSLGYEVMTTLLLSLTPERREVVKVITQHLITMRIQTASMDAILAAIIIEAAESQFAIDGGIISPKDNVLDILRPIFTQKQNKKISKN